MGLLYAACCPRHRKLQDGLNSGSLEAPLCLGEIFRSEQKIQQPLQRPKRGQSRGAGVTIQYN